MSQSASTHEPTPVATTVRHQPSILDTPADQNCQHHGNSGSDGLVATISWTGLAAKQPPQQTAATTSVPAAPKIRIQAPTSDGNVSNGHTSERDEFDGERDNVAVLGRDSGENANAIPPLALRCSTCIAASPAVIVRPSSLPAQPEPASRPWAKELVKKTVDMESAFELSSLSSAASSPSSSCPPSACGDHEKQAADSALAAEQETEGATEDGKGQLRGRYEEGMLKQRTWERFTITPSLLRAVRSTAPPPPAPLPKLPAPSFHPCAVCHGTSPFCAPLSFPSPEASSAASYSPPCSSSSSSSSPSSSSPRTRPSTNPYCRSYDHDDRGHTKPPSAYPSAAAPSDPTTTSAAAAAITATTTASSPTRRRRTRVRRGSRAGVGVWALGARTVLKERGRDAAGGRRRLAYEARNLAFARRHTSAGVPDVLASWAEEEEEEEEEEEGMWAEGDAEGEQEEGGGGGGGCGGAEEAEQCSHTAGKDGAEQEEGQDQQGGPEPGSGSGPCFRAHAADATAQRSRTEEAQQYGAPATAAFLLTSRLPGSPLSSAWDGLSTVARARIAKQVAAHLRDELHAVTSTIVSTAAAGGGAAVSAAGGLSGVDGGPLLNASAFFGVPDDEPVRPCRSVAEIWEVMAQSLAAGEDDHGGDGDVHGRAGREKSQGKDSRRSRDRRKVRQEMILFLRDRMPRMGPFVFSHGNLAASNIMVQDGRFTGFINFESSGFYPIWWDWVRSHRVESSVDGEWKMELRRYMDANFGEMKFEHALDWHAHWMHLRHYGPLSKKAKQSRRKLSRWDRDPMGYPCSR